MDLRALRFSSDDNRTPERWWLAPESPTSLVHSLGRDRPVGFLIRNSNTEDISNCSPLAGTVVDRGREHPAKCLEALVMGYERIPVMRGSHRDRVQLGRSIRTLLSNVQEAGERQAYRICADADLLEDMWQGAEAHEPRCAPRRGFA